jgi:hypothetical protein
MNTLRITRKTSKFVFYKLLIPKEILQVFIGSTSTIRASLALMNSNLFSMHIPWPKRPACRGSDGASPYRAAVNRGGWEMSASASRRKCLATIAPSLRDISQQANQSIAVQVLPLNFLNPMSRSKSGLRDSGFSLHFGRAKALVKRPPQTSNP